MKENWMEIVVFGGLLITAVSFYLAMSVILIKLAWWVATGGFCE